MPKPVSEQVVVITGASTGIGRACALAFAAKGAKVVCAARSAQALDTLVERIRADGGTAVAVPTDVADPAAVQSLAQLAEQQFGRIDTWVNNASVSTYGTVEQMDVDEIRRVIEVNLLGSVRTVRAFLAHVVRTRGYVLQIASVAALAPVPMMSAYCASKSGVEAFAHSLRAEVRHHGVDVGVAYLTWTDTDMVRGADEKPGLGSFRAKIPPPFGTTYPLEPAVARLVDGIERRAAHIYAQWWIRALQWTRAAIPVVAAHARQGDVAAAEEAIRRTGPEATEPVGPGGAAGARGA